MGSLKRGMLTIGGTKDSDGSEEEESGSGLELQPLGNEPSHHPQQMLAAMLVAQGALGAPEGHGGHSSVAAHGGHGCHSHGALLAHPQAQRLVVAYMLEAGVVVHSLIIGLDLGVTTQRGGILGLVAALCLHQFFEGVSLGSFVADAGPAVSSRRKAAMAAVFAATTPAGVLAGLATSETYRPDSSRASWVRGALNGLTGGMLLHMTMAVFIADTFDRPDLGGPRRLGLRLQMYGSLCLGTMVMGGLAIWA